MWKILGTSTGHRYFLFQHRALVIFTGGQLDINLSVDQDSYDLSAYSILRRNDIIKSDIHWRILI